ncbi:universal stress protein [Halodesulfovibrio marinisediminis]|uniref:Nucleotide-binding universal stress protein, UspA family n=1 Tax=Halodesulfovibrio marinisediminis DSM 17456 TaxID=1121457 RepID=A0A1N6IJZ0_9BACT|nr:universal stress protein [Halodesulfovibrio marinisediminis]SIO32358.1 Nucleotide-binding universal stress protein, UspA family [Halodesulfovibrio marinisediminis DSM 17456]
MKIEKILVPVDGSDFSLKAVEYAAEFAPMVGASVVLLTCRLEVTSLLSKELYEKAIKDLDGHAQALLEPYKEIFSKAHVPVTDMVLGGTPEDAILQVAKGEDCDMIIMGSRGYSDIKGLFLGSTTHRVLQLAECPVTVIR